MMETKSEDWISRWGDAYGVEKRLRQAFSTKRAVKLLNWFKEETLPPDPLMFVLIFLVWPVQTLKAGQLPAPKVWRDGFRLCEQTAEWLRNHGESCQLPIDKTIDNLERYAKNLKNEQLSVSIGNSNITFSLRFIRSRNRRDVAKQNAIAFLTGYFKTLRQDKHAKYAEHPPWDVITNFLAVAGLIPPKTTPKHVATVWANSVKRAKKPRDWDESKFGPYELEQYQAGMLILFEMHKDTLYGDGTIRDYSSVFQQILSPLKRYSKGRDQKPFGF